IYRIRGVDARPAAPVDLGRKSTVELVGLLSNGNTWARQSALRLIGDRKDPGVVPLLKRLVVASAGQPALEALWARHLSGGLDAATALATLDHADPYVRAWTVRLLGDDNSVTPTLAAKLAELAKREPNVEVRSQLACSARRLPAGVGLPIVARLLEHDED